MKERTRLILSALIQDFVESASPVASKRLLEKGNFSVSSATVRNEFARLEEIGLIHSPHVSAGKVPTSEGYRFYVDELMDVSVDEFAMRQIIRDRVTEYQLSKSKESVFDVLRTVASLSGNVAFASVENDRTFYIGMSNVLRSPEYQANPEAAAQIIEILEGRNRFEAFLDTVSFDEGDTKIFIGEENLLKEISSCAMVLTSFETNHIKGKLGILGPMRMRYGFNKVLLSELKDLIL